MLLRDAGRCIPIRRCPDDSRARRPSSPIMGPYRPEQTFSTSHARLPNPGAPVDIRASNRVLSTNALSPSPRGTTVSRKYRVETSHVPRIAHIAPESMRCHSRLPHDTALTQRFKGCVAPYTVLAWRASTCGSQTTCTRWLHVKPRRQVSHRPHGRESLWLGGWVVASRVILSRGSRRSRRNWRDCDRRLATRRTMSSWTEGAPLGPDC
jgi:hypothetical protein